MATIIAALIAWLINRLTSLPAILATVAVMLLLVFVASFLRGYGHG